MRAFIIHEGANVNVIRTNQGGYTSVIEPKTMTRDAIFEVEDLVADPTGIAATYAAVPGDHTLAGDFAYRGWYGFKLESKTYEALFVKSSDVQVV